MEGALLTTAEDAGRRPLLFVAVIYALALAAGFLLALASGSRSPLACAAIADAGATLVVFAGSAALDNSSVYDPYWSVAPLFIAASWLLAGIETGVARPLRACLASGLVAVWAGRLTWNWLRRWVGEEDWRYADFRRLGPLRYWATSFVGFHALPTCLVFLGCLPLYAAFLRPTRSFGPLDILAAGVAAAAIWVEARSDRELRSHLKSAPPGGAVLSTGLWALSRHPNYLGEVLFWWGLYGFALAANPAYWWTGIGPASISLLFVFVSVPMMDRHLASRHPEYADELRVRPALLPRLRR